MTKFVVNVCSPRYQRKYQQDGWLPEFYVRYYYYYLLLLMFSIWCPCVRRECVFWGCIRLVDDGCYGHLDQRTWRIARAFGSVPVSLHADASGEAASQLHQVLAGRKVRLPKRIIFVYGRRAFPS